MSNQQPSGSNSNTTPLETQSIRFEDINDEYIAQLLSGYWPQPQNAPFGTSQSMDIPVPFSQATMNVYQSSQDTSTLPAPPATVPSQGYHQFTFDELMRQIDRERELALVPQPGDAAILSTQTSSLQRTQQAQRSVKLCIDCVLFITKPLPLVLSVNHPVQVPNTPDSKETLHKPLVRTPSQAPSNWTFTFWLTIT
jgi:hypothetical protein